MSIMCTNSGGSSNLRINFEWVTIIMGGAMGLLPIINTFL